MSIHAPRFQPDHPDRALHCQESLESAVQELIADANQKGWGTVEVFAALEELLKNLRVAYAEDPDPEDEQA